MLSPDAAMEFQAIYKRNYGIELSCEEAVEQGERLLQMFKIVYRPTLKTSKNEYEKRITNQ